MASLAKDQSYLAMIKSFPAINKVFLDAANDSINHPEVRRIFREENFDLIIAPVLADFIIGLTQLLDAPAIVVCPNAVFGFLHELVGNPNPIATVPNVLVGVTNPMKFSDRIKNMFGWMLEFLYAWYITSTSIHYY